MKQIDNYPSLAIIIASYKELKISRAIEAILKQNIKFPFRIVVSAPDEETQQIVNTYAKKDNRVSLFKDPGKGKSFALNLLLPTITENILILTDGDVYLDNGAINSLAHLFENEKIGCATGRPVPEESRNSKYGYWANFLFDEAHKMRIHAFKERRFMECSGYLFAFRNNVINSFPLDTAEDTIIPYFFWEKGYKIGYVPDARIFVKNVDNWTDWIKQKVRTSKAHESLYKYIDIKKTPREKTFLNEAKGFLNLFRYSKTLHEGIWSTELLFARLYMWMKVFWEFKIKKEMHIDRWERIKSTK